MIEEEKWKYVKDYEDYQVSNLGSFKSLKYNKEKILKQGVNGDGYLHVRLSENKVSKTRTIHQLVAEAFLNHTPCGFKLVVNHINFDKTDNRVNNLELVTNRENTNLKHIKSSSQYTGVCWYKPTKKWMAYIKINGKQKSLGYFSDELEAANAYQNALKNI